MSPILPLFHEQLPYHADSRHYFERIRHLLWPVLLDSTQESSQNNRYDIMAADPFVTLSTTDTQTIIKQRSGEQVISEQDPFLLLQQQLDKFPPQQTTSLPFCGGAIGHFGYDLGRRIEQLPNIAVDNEHAANMLVGLYDWAIITDHLQQQTYLVSFGLHPQTQQQWSKLLELINAPHPQAPIAKMNVSGSISSELDFEHYQIAFNKIKHYIHEGDCYQVNLAKRFEVSADGDPWHAYTLLRQQNAAPFSAFFSTPELTLLSSSPERLLKVHDRRVETKPIKGTRRRDLNDPIRDQALADELSHSVKDRAENLMIVDLLRNDLGKVCEPGSIEVPKPFALESFATVHHLVSTITGQLAEQQNALSLLRACFPGGSITGAPKLRAMEIIEELEPERRGAYCGSMAYIGFDGNMDSNILIRTLVYNRHKLRLWAGGGIVADSKMEDEYQELHDKAAALLALIEQLR